MNEGHALEDLLHVTFNVFHGYAAAVLANTHVTSVRITQLLHTFFGILNDFLKVLVAILEDEILSCLTIITPRVVDVQHTYNIFAIFQLVKHFKLSRHVLACFLGPLNGHSLFGVFVPCLKNVAK